MLTNSEKLKNFPKVYCVNLEEAVDRKYYMLSQFQRFGIDGRFFNVERFSTIKDRAKINKREGIDESPTGVFNMGFPINVSFLRLLKYWYENTNQKYAIFCEDDISFESIDYWNFTWDQFMSKIPEDWDAVQLVRIDQRIENLLYTSPEMFSDPKIYLGRWFGLSGLFRRRYVKRIVERYFDGDTINMFSPHEEHFMEIPENIFYLMPDTKVYNFPLLVEEDRLLNSTFETFVDNFVESRSHQRLNNSMWREFWKRDGKYLNFNEIDSVVRKYD